MGFWSRIFRSQHPVKHTITGTNNPYKARIKWPPDFRQLSYTQQFHFEKTYRRRAKLKHMNPQWVKFVKVWTWIACSSLGIYSVFFYDWPEEPGEEEPAFWTIRQFVFGEYAAIWTSPPEGWKPTPVNSTGGDGSRIESANSG